MDYGFDFVGYAWIIGILMVIVTIVGGYLCAAELRALGERFLRELKSGATVFSRTPRTRS